MAWNQKEEGERGCGGEGGGHCSVEEEEEEGSVVELVLRASTLGPVTKVLNAEVIN